MHGSTQNRMSLAYIDQACNRYYILYVIEQGQLQLCKKKRFCDQVAMIRLSLTEERSDEKGTSIIEFEGALSQSSYGETCMKNSFMHF